MSKKTAPDVAADATDDAQTSGKGRATPTRAEKEAARRRPLVPDTKEARARQKADLAAQREKARVGMAAGDDKYLPPRDKGPQRRFVRDFIDSGYHIGELVMPLMIVVILVTFVQSLPVLQFYAFVILWAYVLAVIVDMVITSTRIKRAATRKFGSRREKGLGWYGAMRTIQMRWMRLPKPQVRRGQRPA
ncbi:hypothetical protein GCM10022240_28310 [Microbacterium kribbense]|uniref:DUF3043 domain-containing protein n=1 Tax=Microbacterium kribbense TaxID=433645 RepID=A0ABP7GVJ2_9MICO